MKTIYLVRHAKSSWDDPFQDDFDRPLNKRGKRDAPFMGKRLKAMNIHPDFLLSSPAERALSTCVLIGEKIGYPPRDVVTDQRLYHAGEEQLLSVLRELDDAYQTVMLFAHNPGLTDFANRLNDELVTDNIPTCGVIAFRVSVQTWKQIDWGIGEVLFFDFPKNTLDPAM